MTAIEKVLYSESINQNKVLMRDHVIKLVNTMIKGLIQSTSRNIFLWRLDVSDEIESIKNLLRMDKKISRYYDDLDLDNIKQEAWQDACDETILPIPDGSTKEKVLNDAYKMHEAQINSWTLENLKDDDFLDNFMYEYMPDSY